jgi:hypothetical protein
MKIRILITTPKGFAKSTLENFIEKLLIGSAKVKREVYTNETDDSIYLELEGDVRTIYAINKKALNANGMLSATFSKSIVKKTFRKLANSEEDFNKMIDMITNRTKIEIIKDATADEIVESGETWLTRLKKKFVRSPPSDDRH